MKTLLLTPLFLIVTSLSANAAIKIQVGYSQSADAFEILDNVSQWLDGSCEPEYRNYWQKHYGVTSVDEEYFKKYKALREKYFAEDDKQPRDPMENHNGFFILTSAMTADPLAQAFYGSATLPEAYLRLGKLLAPEEVQFLQSFFAHFEHQLEPLLQESTSFAPIARKLQSEASQKGVARYLASLARFYKVPSDFTYTVRLVWWPPIERSNASPSGPYLILRNNPVTQLSSAATATPIIFHEVVHTLSAQQPQEQKQSLTRQFLKVCDLRGTLPKYKILEEPLAVALGQILYMEKFEPSQLKFEDSLYNDPWNSAFGKAIFPLLSSALRKNKTITEGFVPAAAKQCAEFRKLAAQLNSSAP